MQRDPSSHLEFFKLFFSSELLPLEYLRDIFFFFEKRGLLFLRLEKLIRDEDWFEAFYFRFVLFTAFFFAVKGSFIYENIWAKKLANPKFKSEVNKCSQEEKDELTRYITRVIAVSDLQTTISLRTLKDELPQVEIKFNKPLLLPSLEDIQEIFGSADLSALLPKERDLIFQSCKYNKFPVLIKLIERIDPS